MTQSKEWPCDHIRKAIVFGDYFWSDNTGAIPELWVCCPICKSERPGSQQENRLDMIIENYVVNPKIMDDMKRELKEYFKALYK